MSVADIISEDIVFEVFHVLAENHPQSNKIMHFFYQKSAPLFAFLLIIERF